MTTIKELTKKYSGKVAYLDLELLISHVLKKTREFVLAHPESRLTKNQEGKLARLLARRAQDEPIAYLLGRKEFFGLDFRVNRQVLVPRPETELLVEKVLEFGPKNQAVIDIGTGSGNIIIALAKNIQAKNDYYALDISPPALAVAKQNAQRHKVGKKIKFLRGNLIAPLSHENLKTTHYVVVANLPYLSEKIYRTAPRGVRKYEPRSALRSPRAGLAHYGKLLKQIKKIAKDRKLKFAIFFEISPEQKPKMIGLAKSLWPEIKPRFYHDLAGKWRVMRTEI